MSEPSASAQPPSYRTVRVDLGARAYDVVIGRDILRRVGALITERKLQDPLVIITDSQVNDLEFAHQLSHGLGPLTVFAPKKNLPVPFGEQSKSMNDVASMISALAKLKMPRSGTIIALGGGVVGDLAGFVAAIYLRGINFVQVPTTLLAMVDSSVGGKTGVNLPEGKNLVGAFYQPKLVVADLDTLKTLPLREFAAGMAEVIKYGAMADRALFDRVADTVLPNAPDLAEIIERCVAIKARIVEKDEFETGTQRALLNFGHTIGHAIEKATGYKAYLHGEAVALGMRAAAWLSHWHLGFSMEDVLALEVAIASNGLPMQLNKEIDPDLIRGALGNDKKVAGDGKNRWVLLKALGEATGGHELPDELVDRAIERLYPPFVLKKKAD
jgi:3-dehydroquinate synthase